MGKKSLTQFLLPLLFVLPLKAAGPRPDPLAGDGNPFSDPAFQDFVETKDGYLNSAHTARLTGAAAPSDLRDSLNSPAQPSLKAALPAAERPDLPGAPLSYYKVTFAGDSGPLGSHVWPLDAAPSKYAREYVFLSILPASPDYTALLSRLEKEADFRFTGEKTVFARKSKLTYLLGWAPYASLDKVIRIKGVSRASVERKNSGVPLKTRVAITLKVPFQNRPNAFVPEFVKSLNKNNGFDSENWFRLPAKSSDSKFSVFNVTGTLPVDMVGEVSRSPFVAAVEFKDSSL